MEQLNESSDLDSLSGNCITSSRLWSTLKNVADSARVTKVADGVDRPLEVSDFKDMTAHIEKTITSLQRLLLKLIKSNAMQNVTKLDKNMRSFLVSSLIVCGEQSVDDIWSTCSTVKNARDILNLLSIVFSIDSQNMLWALESNWDVRICKLMLTDLKPKLQKTSWKHYPASFACYQWILFHVKAYQISECFEEFLHPALIAVDDHESRNQLKGIQCLSHVIINVTRTELCHLGYDDVIYSALEHFVYQKDPEIVQATIPCLCCFLQKVEKGYTMKEDSLQFTRYDKVLEIFLGNMELQQQLSLRKTYVDVLPSFLNAMGLPMLRWSKRLLRIFEDYLLVDDGSNGVSSRKTLEAVRIYILHAWPVVPKNMEYLLEMLLKLLLEMTDLDPSREISPETLATILGLIENCLQLIVKTSNVKAQELCAGIKSTPFNSKFDEIIGRVLLNDIPISETVESSVSTLSVASEESSLKEGKTNALGLVRVNETNTPSEFKELQLKKWEAKEFFSNGVAAVRLKYRRNNLLLATKQKHIRNEGP